MSLADRDGCEETHREREKSKRQKATCVDGERDFGAARLGSSSGRATANSEERAR